MTPEQQAAFINAQAALAILELAELRSRPQTRTEDFKALVERYECVLGHNAVIGLFHGYNR